MGLRLPQIRAARMARLRERLERERNLYRAILSGQADKLATFRAPTDERLAPFRMQALEDCDACGGRGYYTRIRKRGKERAAFLYSCRCILIGIVEAARREYVFQVTSPTPRTDFLVDFARLHRKYLPKSRRLDHRLWSSLSPNSVQYHPLGWALLQSGMFPVETYYRRSTEN